MTKLIAKLTWLTIFSHTILPLLSQAAIKCQEITLTWSSVPWLIRHDPEKNQETIAPLPLFNMTQELSTPECYNESLILQCHGCDKDIYLDTELRALRIRTKYPQSTSTFSGEITATWPDGSQAANILPFFVFPADEQDKATDHQIIPSSSGTALLLDEQTAENKLPFSSDAVQLTRNRKLATAATTVWWPTSTTVDLLDPSTISSSQSYTITSTAKTFSVSYFTLSPSTMSSRFTRSYTVTLDDGSALPSWITWTDSGTDLDFTVYTTDVSKRGTYTIKITATAYPNYLIQLQSTATDKWLKAYNYYDLRVDLSTPGDDLYTVWEVPYSTTLDSKWGLLNYGLNRYVSQGWSGNNNVVCDRTSYGGYEKFTVTDKGSDTKTFQAYFGQYFGIDGTATSKIIATATAVTSSETWFVQDRTVDTLTESATFSMVLSVSCSPTVYDSTSSATKVVYNYLGKTKVITQPFVSDSVNNLYGTGASPSICGTTTVALYENGYTVGYVSASTSTGVPVLTFYTTSQSHLGQRTLTVYYTLTSFSKTTTYTMQAYICLLQPSTVSDQTYIIFKTALTFYASYFTIYPTSASSQFQISYTVTQSSGAAIPSWLTWTNTGTNLKFTVVSTTNSDKGTYSIKITGTATDKDDQTQTGTASETWSITLNDGCPYTDFVNSTPTDWVSTVTYYLGATAKSVSQPFLDDSINKSYGTSTTSSICGLTSITALEWWGNYYWQSVDYVTWSTSAGYPVLRFSTTNANFIATRTLHVKYILTSYTQVDQTFTMSVNICKMYVSSVAAQTYTIFNTELNFSAAYYSISPVAVKSQFVITYTVTKSDGTAKPSWLTWSDSGTDLDFKVYSTTNSDKGTYTIKLTGTATQDGVQVDQLSNTFTITLIDGCPNTKYDIATPTDWVNTITYYLGATAKTVTQPFIDDTINEEFGTSTTSSICGTTSITALEWWGNYYWQSVDYVTWLTSAGYPVLKISTTNANWVATRTLHVKYFFTSYSSISKTLTMTVHICKMYVSSITAQTYTIFKTALTFSGAYYSISPAAARSSFNITYTVTKSDGTTIPSWLTWSDSGTDLDFRVYSTTNSDKGTYTIKITGTAKQDDVQVDSLSNTFTITLYDGCPFTTYDTATPTDWVSNATYYLGAAAKTVTQPFIDDIINEGFGTSTTSSICGTTSITALEWWGNYYWQSVDYVTWLTSAGYPVLTISSTKSDWIGTRTLHIKYYFTSYTTISKTLTMSVHICKMYVSSVPAQSYTIFKTALNFSAAYYSISPIAAKSSFVITYTVTKSDGSTKPSWLTWSDSGTDLDFSVYSTTNSEKGTYTIKITGTVQQDSVQVDQLSNTFTITLNDGCPFTAYDTDNSTDWVDTITYYLGSTAKNVTQPFINDQINESFGTSTTSSICGATDIVAQELWDYYYYPYTRLTDVSYVNESTTAGYPVLSFYETDSKWVATRTLYVKYYLKSYSTISKTLTMKVNICKMYVSSVTAQTYTIFKTALSYSAAYYSISPVAAKSSFVITYTVTKSDGTSIPSWLTWSDSGTDLDFRVYSTTNSDKGTYTIKITGTAKQDDVQVDQLSNTFTITLNDGCPFTVYDTAAPTDWVSTVTYLVGATAQTVTLPFIDDTINEGFGSSTTSSICGNTSITTYETYYGYYYYNRDYLTAATSAGQTVLTIFITTTDYVGDRTLYVKYYLTSYSSISRTLTINVRICFLNAPSTTTQYYTIYKTALVYSVSYFWITPTSAKSEFTITYATTLSDGSVAPSWLTFTDSGTDLDFRIYSEDNDDKGTYTIKITATAKQDGVQNGTQSTTFQVILQDGCPYTYFLPTTGNPTDWNSSQVYYLGEPAINVTQPYVDDYINDNFGTNTTSSVCGSSNVYLRDSGYTQTYATSTMTAGQTVLKFYETNSAYVGTRTLDITYYLSSYTSITRKISMTVYICQLVAPTIISQTYTIFKTASTFTVAYFTITPTAAADKFTISHAVTKSDDTAKPDWLTLTDTGSLLSFSVYSTDNNDIGIYTIKITATAKKDSVQVGTLTKTFTITLNDGCPYTVYQDFPSTVVTDVVYYVTSAIKTVNQTFLDDTINDQFGTSQTSSICGTTSVSFSENGYGTSGYLTSTQNVSSPVFSIKTDWTAYVGPHTVIVRYYLTSYTSISKSFTMIVYICNLVAPTTTDQTYIIFKDALTFSVAYFTITPSTKASSFTIDHEVTKSDGTTKPDWLSVTDSGTDLDFSVQSDDQTDKETYTIMITATAKQDNVQVGTLTKTFKITMNDGCSGTVYDTIPSSAVLEAIQYIGNTKIVTQPFINDSANIKGGSSTSSSICGTTSITLSDTGYYSTPGYVSVSTTVGYPVLTFPSSNSGYVGTHTLTLKYYLTSWTSTTTSFTMKVYICTLVAPATSIQYYTIFKTAVTFSVAYFTISPTTKATSFTIQHEVTLSDGTSLPSWVTVTDSGTDLDFSVFSNDNDDKGTYTIMIQATATVTPADGQVGTLSTTFKIILKDGCSETDYDAVPSQAVLEVIQYIGNTKIVTQPFISDSANNADGSSTTSSLCGTTSITLSEAGYYSTPGYVSVSTTAGYPVLTFASSNSGYIGTHSLAVKYYLTSWTSTTTSFTMTAYICTLVAPTAAALTYTIYEPAFTFSVPYFTISPSSQQSKFNITHSITKSDDSALPNWLTFVDSGTDLDFTAESDYYNDKGTYNIKITATATLNDGQIGTLAKTFTITLKDGCLDTSFDSTSTALKEWVYYIGNKIDLSQPWVSDNVNNLHGTSTTESICGPTTVTASDTYWEYYYQDPMATGSVETYSPVLTFETLNTQWVGDHTLTVRYTLSRYTSITTAYNMKIWLCILKPPTITDKSYTIFSGTQTYQVSYFTINPASQQSQFTITHPTVTQSDGSALWSWLTWTDSGSALVFSIVNSDYSDAGTYTVKINAKAVKTNGDGQFGTMSTTFKFILIDPCNSNPTAYVNTNTATTSASFLLGTTKIITYPWFSDTVNNLYGTATSVSLCYTTTASVWESGITPTYVSVVSSSSTPVLTFITSTTSFVGTHSITVKYTLDRYTTITLSLPMTVYICTLVPPTIAQKSYTIFSGSYTFTVPYFTISPISQQSIYTRSHIATQSDGTALWSWLTFQDSGSELLSFTASSTTYTDDNTAYSVTGQEYTVKITSTATMSDGQTQTISTTFTIVVTDPCKNTILISQTIPDQWQFIGAHHKPLAVKMPLITDTINKRYGSDPLNSICFTQFIKSKEEDFESPNFVNLSIQKSGVLYTTMKISENDDDLFGPHVVDFTYTLDRYPHIQATKTATLNLIKVIPPSQPEDYIYYINSDTIKFSVDMMQVEPMYSNIQFSYQVTQVGGTTIPSFLSYSEDNSLNQKLDFEILTWDSEDIGKYYIQINATATHPNQQSASEVVKFWITVKANATDQTLKAQAPQWTTKVQDPLFVTVGQPSTYTLPPAVSPAGNSFKIDVDLGAASSFVTYQDGTFQIGNTTNQQAGTYSVKVTITDSKGAVTRTTMNIIVRAPIIIQKVVIPPEKKWPDQSQETQKLLQKFDSADQNIKGWSFTEAFLQAKANGAKSPIPPKPPTVSFSDISRNGELLLTFSKEMVVPPLPKLQNLTAANSTDGRRRLQEASQNNDSSKYCGVGHPKVVSENHTNTSDLTYECAPAQPKLIPGDSSDVNQLGYSFRVISQTAKQLKMQLVFENPLAVSTDPNNPEWVEIHFIGHYFFFDKDGLTIAEDTVVRRRVPVQVPIDADLMISAGVATTAGVQAFMVVNFIGMLAMAGAMSMLWGMVNTMQIILMLPLFNVSIPGNAATFYGFLMQIASLDIIPTDLIYNDIFGWTPSEPINENFDSDGYGSTMFIYNIGSLMIWVTIYPILVALYLLLGISCCVKKGKEHWSQKTKNWLHHSLFYGEPIVTFTESFIVIAMCTLINFEYMTWNGEASNSISSLMTLISLIFIICFPVCIAIFLLINWRRLPEKEFVEKWGAFYELLDLKAGKWVILEPVTFLVRRLFLCAVVLYTKKLVYQFLVIIATCMWQIFLLCIVKPYKEKSLYNMEIFNECVIMMVTYCFMLFSDIMYNAEMEFDIGYIACVLTAIHMIVCMGLMLYQNISGCREKIRLNRQKKINLKQANDKLIAKIVMGLKGTELSPIKSKKEVKNKIQNVPEQVSQLEEIKEALEIEEQSSARQNRSQVNVVVDEQVEPSPDPNVEPLTDRNNEQAEFEMRKTAMQISASRTINEWDVDLYKFDVPSLPAAPYTMKEWRVQEELMVSPQEEEKKDDTSSQMNRRLKRVLITKDMQTQIRADVTLDMIDDAFRLKKI